MSLIFTADGRTRGWSTKVTGPVPALKVAVITSDCLGLKSTSLAKRGRVRSLPTPPAEPFTLDREALIKVLPLGP